MNKHESICQKIKATQENNDKAALIACLMNLSADKHLSPALLKKASESIQEATSMIRELLGALEAEVKEL